MPMLRSLVHSKHKMISMGSSAALKNLLAAMPEADLMDRGSRGESDAAKMYHSNLTKGLPFTPVPFSQD